MKRVAFKKVALGSLVLLSIMVVILLLSCLIIAFAGPDLPNQVVYPVLYVATYVCVVIDVWDDALPWTFVVLAVGAGVIVFRNRAKPKIKPLSRFCGVWCAVFLAVPTAYYIWIHIPYHEIHREVSPGGTTTLVIKRRPNFPLTTTIEWEADVLVELVRTDTDALLGRTHCVLEDDWEAYPDDVVWHDEESATVEFMSGLVQLKVPQERE